MTTSVTQTVHLDADVERVYRALTDSAEHTAFTDAPAEINTEAGQPFSTHGGAIQGITLDAVAGSRLVQAWRPGDWPEGVFSVVRYDLAASSSGTDLTLTHTGLPDGAAEPIADGWQQRYWGPLRDYLAT